MSVRSSRQLRSAKKVLEEETPLSPLSSITTNSKRQKKIRKTNDLVYFSPDCPSKNSIDIETDVQPSAQQKPEKTQQRKIIRAKRLLKNTIKFENSETVSSVKEKRRTLKRQENVDFESFDLTKETEINSENEPNQDTDNNKNEIKQLDVSSDATFILNEKMFEEEEKQINLNEERTADIKPEGKKLCNESTTLVITTLADPISPSSNSEELKTESASLKYLHFNISPEILQPSMNGCVEESAPRRRTFELENSVNDVSLLKVLSMNDSSRMSSFPSEEEPLPSPIAPVMSKPFSKVTVRRKWEKAESFERLSKSSPPWEANDNNSDSTPEKVQMPLKKPDSILKSVLNKETHKSAGKKVGSGIKVPNFAAIHQRNFEKMESLTDYKKRKEERAKMLLSGRKPKDEMSKIKTPKESRKQLRFAEITFEKKNSSTYIPLPSTPVTKEFINKSNSNNFQIKTPNFKFTQGDKENPFTVFKQSSITKKVQADKIASNSRLPVKILGMKNTFEKRRPLNSENKGLHGRDVLYKKEEIKTMVATKSKPTKRSLEKRRDIIKGVRSNRRFELLMNMRKGK